MINSTYTDRTQIVKTSCAESARCRACPLKFLTEMKKKYRKNGEERPDRKGPGLAAGAFSSCCLRHAAPFGRACRTEGYSMGARNFLQASLEVSSHQAKPSLLRFA